MTIRTALAGAGALALALAAGTPAAADSFNFRVASGHPPTIIYVALMQKEFVPRLKKRLEALGHTGTFNEAYGGSLVKVAETFEGVQDGIVDIGGFCVCFEPANLYLHNYSLWMPFDPPTATVAMKGGRAVYDRNPELEAAYGKHNQKLLALSGTDNYGLWSKFDWKDPSELKGRKIAGAGPNLPWVEKLGAVPVSTSAPEVYSSLSTGVYDAVVWLPFDGMGAKVYEPAPYYKIVGFGAKSTLAITINTAVWNKLPPAVQKALVEVGREIEDMSGPWIDAAGTEVNATLVKNGAKISTITPEAQKAWAEALKDFPGEKARDADTRGWPGTKAMAFAVDEAERLGHKWPVRYVIK